MADEWEIPEELDVGKEGYAYDYRLSKGTMPTPFFAFRVKPDQRNYVLDVRVAFNMKKINDEVEIIGSENYMTELYAPGEPNSDSDLSKTFKYRLEEYWMSNDQLTELKKKLFDLAEEIDVDPQSPILKNLHIIVEIDVFTLQQKGEKIDAAMKRAMKKENLLALYMWPFELDNGRKPGYLRRPHGANIFKVLVDIPRKRIPKLYDAWRMMRICGLCSEGPYLWSQMTVMKCCKRVYHSKCIFRHLLTFKDCPSCNAQVYDRRVVYSKEYSSLI